MGTPDKKSSSILPKINQKLAYRTLALVVVVGGLAWGLEWFLKVRSDLDRLRTSETVGWISAVEYLPQGQQAVLISPDGKVHKDPGYVANTTDRDLTWSPGGNFLYFVSDRVDHNFNVFRWSPASDKPADQRTIGTRARGDLRFPAQLNDEPDSEAKGLITTGGLVQEFDPVNTSTGQILPPTSKEISQDKSSDESGTQSQFEGAYGNLGTSFREAQWCGGKRYIAAVMRRDAGEILIVQEMQPVDGKFPLPRPIVAGEHVDFAINPSDGSLVYCVQGFQWPEGKAPLDKDGKPVQKKFVNAAGVFNFGAQNFLLQANKGDYVFSSPSVSPDGTTVVVMIGKNSSGIVTPEGIGTLPAKNDPGFKPHQFRGNIYEPSWSPDSKRLIAAVRINGKPRTIYEIPLDGTAVRSITGDAGNFGFPRYSPQQKAN